MGRKIEKVRQEILPEQTSVKSRRDFAWNSRKKNPHFASVDQDSHPKKMRRSVLALMFLCFLASSVYLLLFHSFFQIKTISVHGNQRVLSTTIEETAWGILQKDTFVVFPGTNYFLLPTDDIQDILLSRYPLQQVVVSAVFPNTLSILVEERLPAIVYDNGQQYFYLDIEGKVIEPLRHVTDDEWYIEKAVVTSTMMVSTTLPDGTLALIAKEIQEEKEVSRTHVPPTKKLRAEFGLYPVIYDKRMKQGEVNTILLESSYVKSALSWTSFISSYLDSSVSFIFVENIRTDARIKTGEGWDLLVRLDRSPDEQFTELQNVLKTVVDRSTLRYVDLRYPGRMYWQ